MRLKLYLGFIGLACFVFIGKQLLSQVVINEYSVSNLNSFPDNYGKYEDWIELYNKNVTAIDLSGFSLSDKQDNPLKWQFPAGTTIDAGGFLRVWASGRDEVSGSHYHTNFKLSQTKAEQEYIVFSNPFGTILDLQALEITQKEHSRGRTADGEDEWGIFKNPTPKNSNNGTNVYSAYTEKPQMSVDAGFHSNPVMVELFTSNPDLTIRYTLDGSEPGTASPVYSEPIMIDETTIINARSFSSEPDLLPGLITFNTYFINEQHTMAVISASAAQLDDLLNGNQSLRPFGTFEYFNKNGERTNVGYGEFNEHGQDSWVHDQRSIDYITRDECGYNHAILGQIIPITDRDEFQRLILRAAGDDNYPGIDTSALLRDFFIQNTACKSGMNLDVRKGEKGILYANGQYWGIYGYREKVSDHDFTDYYYDQDKYHIYYLKLWGSSWAEYGGQAAWDDWNDLHNFIKFNDMSDPENFDYVKSRYDYTSLVDYVLINSYVVCSDWINWNVGWWRGLNPEGSHLRWGYTLWDEDATFGHYINYTGVPGQNPYVSPCFPEGLTNDPEEHIVALNKLRENEEFDQYYISRYVDLLNTAFNPSNMIAYLDSIEGMMVPEMPKHVQRWGGSVQQWENNVEKIRNFIGTRYSIMPQGLIDCYDLSGPYEFTLNIDPPEAGHVLLNSLEITGETFNGMYYGGVETKLTAMEVDPNYEFDFWETANHTVFPNDSTKSVILDLVTGDVITAHFKPRLFADSLVINEINYNSSAAFDTEDWVEFYNPQPHPVQLAGWQFKDEDDEHIFTFPESAAIPAFGYLVLCRDTVAFKLHFPRVGNLMGNTDFGLSGSGELIRLFNQEGVLIDTVHYDDNAPWPIEPDGNGPTLELINPVLNNALAQSWMASPDHGTPGAMNSLMTAVSHSAAAPQFAVEVYPNPVHDQARIKISRSWNRADLYLEVFSLHGQWMTEIDIGNGDEVKIDCSLFLPGLYLVKVTDRATMASETAKFMVDIR